MRIRAALTLTTAGLLSTGCNLNLVDNAPAPTVLYFAASSADLATCDAIKLNGTALKVVSPSIGYHLDTQANGYAKTALTQQEGSMSGGTTTFFLRRAGTYAYNTNLVHAYNWSLAMSCEKTGKSSLFSQKGLLKQASSITAVVFTIKANADGSLSATQAEYPDALSPQEKHLP